MTDASPVAQPFLDWYGIWPGQAGRDDKGHAWLEDPPLGIQLKPQAARKSEPFLQAGERPWEERGLGGLTVIHEDGYYRIWYTAGPSSEGEGLFICYAESDDGRSWHRPDLQFHEFRGSKANNILFEQERFRLDSVFSDPAAPPEQRYKAIAHSARYYRRGELVPSTPQNKEEIHQIRRSMQQEGRSPELVDAEAEVRAVLEGAVSADGLHWEVLEQPLIDVGKTMLDTQSIAAHDADSGEYVAYLRGHVERRRGVRRTGGREFGNWPPTRMVLLQDPADEADEDVYGSCYCRSPGSGRHLMFPPIFHRLVATRDVQLATSRDGWNWSRPWRQPIIDLDSDDGPYSMVFPQPNLVPLGDEWGLPCLFGDQRHDTWGAGPYFGRNEYRWALWKPDRLVALVAPAEGKFTTVERLCEGSEMRLNFQTEVGGWIRAALAHKPTTPPTVVEELDGFGMGDCDVLEGDEVSRVVTWKGKSDLSALKGREVSVRFSLARAKLFSLAL